MQAQQIHEKKTIILLIAEGHDTRKILSIFLEPRDFKIVHGTRCQGVRLCASIKPDLVIVDTDLPEIVGRAIIKGIRDWSQVPLIMLSACSDDESVIAILEVGANDYVSKPFNGAVLYARMIAALRTATVRSVGEPTLWNGALMMDLIRHE